MRSLANAILVAVGILSTAPALAADLAPPPAPAPIPMPALSDWHYEVSLDGWAPSLNVGMGIRSLPVPAGLRQHLPNYPASRRLSPGERRRLQ